MIRLAFKCVGLCPLYGHLLSPTPPPGGSRSRVPPVLGVFPVSGASSGLSVPFEQSHRSYDRKCSPAKEFPEEGEGSWKDEKKSSETPHGSELMLHVVQN